jgi:site-specific recombinase XerD
MRFIETNGLENTDLMPKSSVPIYLSDDYKVLEGPTYWIMKLTQMRSRSIETLKQYSTILARYLQWRDDRDYKAEAWQNVDEDIINEYITYLIEIRDKKGKPSDSAIEFYIARLQSFYKWANENGYKHYWKMDTKKVIFTVRNRSMVNMNIERDALSFHLQTGRSTHVDANRDKFIHRENIPQIMRLFDDVVYAFIALIIWITALRPKELFQLPYKGTGLNEGLRRYQYDELEELTDILFEFESKGKRRSIKFPAYLWVFICTTWMPKRAERAALYRKKHGMMPPNIALFLSKSGDVVTRKMLRDNFLKVAMEEECPENRLTPYMFRHSFATYFVFGALKKSNLLGRAYVYNAVIDQALREWMGHNDIDTTYKYYVHLVNRYFHNDLLDDIYKDENKAIFDIIERL